MWACGVGLAAAAQDIGTMCHSLSPGPSEGKAVLPQVPPAFPHHWPLLPRDKSTERCGTFSKGWCRLLRDEIASSMGQSRWHSAEQEGNRLTVVCPVHSWSMRAGPYLPILNHYFSYLKAGIANWRPSGHNGPTNQFYAHMVLSFSNFLKNGKLTF